MSKNAWTVLAASALLALPMASIADTVPGTQAASEIQFDRNQEQADARERSEAGAGSAEGAPTSGGEPAAE